jgi:hypothetical protein
VSNETSMPSELFAGDSMRWTQTVSDYPASEGWTLTYTFKDATGIKLEKDATASGDDYLVTITPAETVVFMPGGIGWAAVVENADRSERRTVGSGYLLVRTNPAEGAGVDPRSIARQALDAIESTMLGASSQAEGTITYADGKSIVYRNLKELEGHHAFWANKVRQEEKASRIAQGLDSGNNIRIRFSSI